MKQIQCLVIDDEPLARALVVALLARDPMFKVAGECASAVEAFEMLVGHPIDVMFLDIQMPVISGMDFLRSLKHMPKVVFTTAYAEFAAEAFNMNAVDYLVKPITEERFAKAVLKLRSVFSQAGGNNPGPAPEINYTFFKADGKLLRVEFSKILYLEALKDFTRIHLADGRSILVGEHLKAVENSLPGSQFIRVHRSYVASLAAITGIQGNILEIGLVKIPVGGNYREELFRMLKIS